jgi:hypothetical protein
MAILHSFAVTGPATERGLVCRLVQPLPRVSQYAVNIAFV